MDKILILDFGSQTTQLIGRRIRELGVYTEILPGDADLGAVLPQGGESGGAVPGTAGSAAAEGFAGGIRGIILSGSPASVYDPDAPAPDRRIYACGLPLLGICYGLQKMNVDNGGEVAPLPKREYGGVKVRVLRDSTGKPGMSRPGVSGGRFNKRPGKETFTAWMSHGDTLTKLAPGFTEVGRSETGYPAVLVHREKPWYGLQFHPEVTHCERGQEILASFVFGICRCRRGWSMEAYVETMRGDLTAKVGDTPVLLLVSGGVDSTAAAALLLKTLPASRVHLMYMDTGLMRKDETTQIKAALEKLGAEHLHMVSCGDEFFAALKGLEDPEAKRKVIGDLFITIQEREVAALGLPSSYFLAQGTLYTDLIESGAGVGKKARVIKCHHNVGSPLVEAKRQEGRIIEPLDRLYKDEVRALGRLLGVEEETVRRHPFPGPGLAVRILGEVTREKCAVLREADAVFIGELKKRPVPGKRGVSLYDSIWQAFAVLLPVRSVGVAGDLRRYGWVLALRAVTSADGMTAGVYPFLARDLAEIATLITNTVKDIGRVCYDISSKPPATIEWE
ncbi:MAG: glutamine-hydrolyzing GMP synthase [Treponema sp.]|nr:glutamine-hydrolyzing GMP synthase [Treponema sp.]